MNTKSKLLLLAIAAAPLMLSGCIVVPARPAYVGPPSVVVQPYGYYGYGHRGYYGGYYGGHRYRY